MNQTIAKSCFLLTLLPLAAIPAQTHLASAGAKDNLEKSAITSATVLPLRDSPLVSSREEAEQVDRSVVFPPGGTLEIRNFSGDVQVTGTSGKDVVIHAIRRGKRELLDHIAARFTLTAPW